MCWLGLCQFYKTLYQHLTSTWAWNRNGSSEREGWCCISQASSLPPSPLSFFLCTFSKASKKFRKQVFKQFASVSNDSLLTQTYEIFISRNTESTNHLARRQLAYRTWLWRFNRGIVLTIIWKTVIWLGFCGLLMRWFDDLSRKRKNKITGIFLLPWVSDVNQLLQFTVS